MRTCHWIAAGVAMIAVAATVWANVAMTPAEPIGIFEDHRDIGTVLHPGSVAFNPDRSAYTVSGSGENMWAAKDAFHYAWKQASGDLSLAADVSFLGAGTDPHRKACLIIRQG